MRLSGDYHMRIAGNDYSVEPTAIGQFVDVHAYLATGGCPASGCRGPARAMLDHSADDYRSRERGDGRNVTNSVQESDRRGRCGCGGCGR